MLKVNLIFDLFQFCKILDTEPKKASKINTNNLLHYFDFECHIFMTSMQKFS